MTDTLPKLLLDKAKRWPDRVALREKALGIWRDVTWSSYADRVRHLSLGLRALGLERGDKVVIAGDNRVEWIVAELAAQSAGAIAMGVYQDSVAEELRALVDASHATFLVVEDQEQVDKVLEIRDSLESVQTVIFWDPRGMRSYDAPFLKSLAEVSALGESRSPDGFEALVSATSPDDVALFATTSGTTGRPKLAMLTHRNLLSMAHHLDEIDPLVPEDRFLSFLPLAWVGEQMMSVSSALHVGFTVHFPEEPETVPENLRETGPQVIFSPPRIWENLISEIQVKHEDASWLKRRVYDWALSRGEPDAPLRRGLTHLLCSLWIQDQMGLRHLKRAYTGGAALGPDVLRFFHTLGVNLKQIYGQTEVSGVSVVHRDGDVNPETMGVPIPGTEIRIADDGEILTRSSAVFSGYFENEEATAQSLRNGWLHSGDAGYLTEEGHLVVIDRAQDVTRLSDGTLFSPQFVENKLKFIPYVREAVVFGGEDRPFVTALIVMDFRNVGKWAERRQMSYTTFTDLAQQDEVYELIKEHVARVNQSLPETSRIRRFLLLHKELDADDAELTRTRKVRRRFVAERYRELIDALFGESDRVAVETEVRYQDGRTSRMQTAIRIEQMDHPDTIDEAIV